MGILYSTLFFGNNVKFAESLDFLLDLIGILTVETRYAEYRPYHISPLNSVQTFLLLLAVELLLVELGAVDPLAIGQVLFFVDCLVDDLLLVNVYGKRKFLMSAEV